MAKGKYAHRADTRLQVLQSEALRNKQAEVDDLKRKLANAQNECNTLRSEINSKAMSAAAALAGREKQNLRDQIASLEYGAEEQRIRSAVLTWEMMHRLKFGRPAPPAIQPGNESAEMQETFHYYCEAWHDIAALFLTDPRQYARFEEMVYNDRGIRYSGGENIRKTTRRMGGQVFNRIMVRERRRQSYYERVWRARLVGRTEPVEQFDTIMDEAEKRDVILKKMRNG